MGELTIAEHEMPGLMATRTEFGPAQPFKGMNISGSLHMTIQTGVLIETLSALGAKGRQSFDEHTSLNGHVQRATDVHALEWLCRAELGAGGHQAWHLMLGNGQLPH